MGGKVDIVEAGGPGSVGDVGLAVGKDGVGGLREDDAIEVIVGNDLDADVLAGGEGHGDGGDVVVAVAASGLEARFLRGGTADHDVVDVAAGLRGDDVRKALVDLRGAGGWDGHVVLRKESGSGQQGEGRKDDGEGSEEGAGMQKGWGQRETSRSWIHCSLGAREACFCQGILPLATTHGGSSLRILRASGFPMTSCVLSLGSAWAQG
jgi:hypothetical protein